MYKRTAIFLISALLSLKVSNTATVPRDAAANAKNVLSQLKSVVIDGVAAALTDYVAMSKEVDSTAQATKGSSTEDILIKCVNDQAKEVLTSISDAAVKVTDYAFFPITEAEKRLLITCGGTDEGCINGVIEDLKSQVDSTPDTINGSVTTDRKKIEDRLSIIQACRALVDKLPEAVAPSDLAEDARAALDAWRELTMTGLYRVYDYLSTLSDDIDSTTLKARDSGTGDEFIECVNDLAEDSIGWVYSGYVDFTEEFLSPIYYAEIELVACGLFDEDCINAVFTEIIKGFNSTSDDINTEIALYSQYVNPDLTYMQIC